MNRRRAGLLILQSLFGAGLLAIWIRAVDLPSIGVILSQARWSLVVVAAVLGLASTVARVMRWRIVLWPIAQVPFLNLYAIAATAALANFLVPLRTGEAAKGLLLKKRHGASFAAALPTVAIDRSFDLIAVLALGTVGAFLGVRLNGGHSAIILLGGTVLLGFVAAVAAAVLGRERIVGLLERWVPERLGSRLKQRIVGVAEAFLRGFSTAWRGRQDLSSILLLTAVATVLDAGALYLLFAAVGTPAALPIMATGFALLTLTWIVPAAPAYIGSTEAFGSLIFTHRPWTQPRPFGERHTSQSRRDLPGCDVSGNPGHRGARLGPENGDPLCGVAIPHAGRSASW